MYVRKTIKRADELTINLTNNLRGKTPANRGELAQNGFNGPSVQFAVALAKDVRDGLKEICRQFLDFKAAELLRREK